LICDYDLKTGDMGLTMEKRRTGFFVNDFNLEAVTMPLHRGDKTNDVRIGLSRAI